MNISVSFEDSYLLLRIILNAHLLSFNTWVDIDLKTSKLAYSRTACWRSRVGRTVFCRVSIPACLRLARLDHPSDDILDVHDRSRPTNLSILYIRSSLLRVLYWWIWWIKLSGSVLVKTRNAYVTSETEILKFHAIFSSNHRGRYYALRKWIVITQSVPLRWCIQWPAVLEMCANITDHWYRGHT